MKKSYLFALALLTFLMVGITPGVQAQLTAGDLAIIYYRSDAVDTVTVITLVPLSNGDQFYITDESVHNNGSSANPQAFDTDLTAKAACFTATTAIPAYTVITYASGGPSSSVGTWQDYTVAHPGSVVFGSGNLSISSTGDQAFIFVDSNTDNAVEPGLEPTFIFALQSNNTGWEINLANNPVGGRSVEPKVDVTNPASAFLSTIPASINLGGSEDDNEIYTGTTSFTNQADALSNITNPSNWTGSNPTPTSGTTIANRSALIHKTATPFSGPAAGPTALCQNLTVPLSAAGTANISASALNGGSFGGTAPLTFAASQTSFTCNDIGINTETLTVTDANSATATCTATVNISDVTAPTAVCQPATVQLGSGGSATIMPSMVDGGSNDACGGSGSSLSRIVSPSNFSCSQVGQQTVTLTVNDAPGNSATCTATVTVEDNLPPVITCQNVTVFLDANGNGDTSPYTNGALISETDNCSTVGGIGVTGPSPKCSSIGPVTRVIKQDDPSGNEGQCTYIQTTVDALAPNAVCNNATVSLDGSGNASIAGSDLGGGSTDNCGIATFSASKTTFDCSDLGTVSVNLDVIDGSGNSAGCSAMVTVNNNNPPTASCQNFTFNLPATTGSITASQVNNGSTDVCGSVSLSASPSVFSCTDVGPNTVTLTVISDGNGLSSTCTATVTVADPNSFCCGLPTASCKNATVNLDPMGNVTLATSAIDNGSTAPCGLQSLSASPFAFDCDDIGPNSVTLTVTDINNNYYASCEAIVTIRDNMASTARCQDVTVDLNQNGFASVSADDMDNGSDDNCGISSLTASPSSFDCSHLGGNIVTLIVNDVNGNQSTCTALVTVDDNIPPSLSLIGADPIVICEGDALIDPGATIHDNCDSGTTQGDAGGVDTENEGTYSITYDYTDAGGNTAIQISRTVIVENTPAQLAPQNCGSCSQIRFDFCEGDPVPDLEALLMGNTNYEPGVTFNWYADNNNSQGSPIGTPSVNTNRNSRRFYWVSQQDDNCEGPARRVRVRVRKTSIVVFNLPSQGCGGATIDLAAWVYDSRNIATGFTFYDADPDVGSPTPLGSVSATNGQVNAGQSLIINLSVGLQTFYATATNNTGCQETGSSQISVGATPLLDFVPNYTVNHGDMVNIPFTSPNANYIVWVDHPSFGNPNIGIIGGAGLGNLMFMAQNTSGAPQTAMIRAIAYIGNCAGQVRDFFITVNPGAPNRQAQQHLLVQANLLSSKAVQIDWDIRYAFELTGFEVEKMQADGSWLSIAELGWNPTQEKYSFIDEEGAQGEQMYRVKLVHPDGRWIWSDPVSVEIGNQLLGFQDFSIYPNPADGRFNLQAVNELQSTWNYVITDLLGRTIERGTIEDRKTAFDISNQAAGQYYLILNNSEGNRFVKKIVKQ